MGERVLHTSSESLPSASRSTISMMSSYSFSPVAYPCAQLFPAPPPSWDIKIFSGLYKLANGDVKMLLMTCRVCTDFGLTAPMYKAADAPVARGQSGSREEYNAHRLLGKRIRLYGRPLLSPSPRGCPLCLYHVRRRAAARRRSPLRCKDGTDENRKSPLLLRIPWLPHWPICTVTISRGMALYDKGQSTHETRRCA